MGGSSIVDKKSLYTSKPNTHSNPNTNSNPKPSLQKMHSTWWWGAKESELSGHGFELSLPSRQEGAGNRTSMEGLCM